MRTYETTFVCFGLQGVVNIPVFDRDEIYESFNAFISDCDDGFYSKNGQPDADAVKELIGDLLAEDFGVDVSEVEWSTPSSDMLDNSLAKVDLVS